MHPGLFWWETVRLLTEEKMQLNGDQIKVTLSEAPLFGAKSNPALNQDSEQTCGNLPGFPVKQA